MLRGICAALFTALASIAPTTTATTTTAAAATSIALVTGFDRPCFQCRFCRRLLTWLLRRCFRRARLFCLDSLIDTRLAGPVAARLVRFAAFIARRTLGAIAAILTGLRRTILAATITTFAVGIAAFAGTATSRATTATATIIAITVAAIFTFGRA